MEGPTHVRESYGVPPVNNPRLTPTVTVITPRKSTADREPTPRSIRPWWAYLLSLIVTTGCAACLVEPCFAGGVEFDREVAPILASHCLECHSGNEPEGDLSLVDDFFLHQRESSDSVIVAGASSDSSLWQRIATDEMPPKHPLSESDKSTIRRWIDEGAQWGTSPIDRFAITTDTRAGRDWWSLQPVASVVPPAIESASWGNNAIDAFIQRRLHERGLAPAPAADPRSLVRRLYFDLVGLPPSPEVIATFAADPSESAYQAIVDELLASKHYGERWARHWMDVVRFGESDGFERNFPRENAWSYRDWLIDSINNDMPYDEFVRMQLIGDQMVGGIEGATATGFWVAGVHNTVVGGSKRMRELARQDEIEDVLATIGQTFLGLTVHCARCHDHKFDPITQVEYYKLASSISGLDFGELTVTNDSDSLRLQELNQQIASTQSELQKMQQTIRDRVIAQYELASQHENSTASGTKTPDPVAQWDFDKDFGDSRGSLHAAAVGNARIEDGALVLDGESYVETGPLAIDVAAKSLEVFAQLSDGDQSGGAVMSLQSQTGDAFDAIVYAEQEPKRWLAGSESFVRTASFAGTDETLATETPVHLVWVYAADGMITAYRNGEVYGRPIRKSPIHLFPGETSQILFGLRHKPAGGNRFLRGRILQASFYDSALTADEIGELAARTAGVVTQSRMEDSLTPEQRQHRESLTSKIADLTRTRDKHVASTTRRVYTLKPGKATTTHVLLRGDPDTVGDVVTPGAIASVFGPDGGGDFQLSADAADSERRKKLAMWITDPMNPLFARVIVNRIWHYHFGTGIVDTPNDFGFNGGRPSHPELLDYLVGQFRADGYRLKPLHRMIVTSSAYRQSARDISETDREKAMSVDATNRLLWHGPSRRLEAESVRDAMLVCSGKLNDQVGGASFKDVSVTENKGTTYYEHADVDGHDVWRRTVYRFSPRGGRSALLDTFDCPDPASTSPRRTVTTTPLQALSLLNNSFVLTMSNHFADRLVRENGDDAETQVDRAWQLAIGRSPSDDERELSLKLVRDHGLAALCRGLFNINEFVAID